MANWRHERRKRPWWHWPILVLLSPALLMIPLLILIVGLAVLLSACGVRVGIWTFWCLRGRDVLVVYSESPYWGEFFDAEVVPRLGKRVVMLNRSVRSASNSRLAKWAYEHFGGSRGHYPLAIVFRPWGRTRVFRFFQPFRDWKHGKPAALEKVLNAFFAEVGVAPPALPPPPALAR